MHYFSDFKPWTLVADRNTFTDAAQLRAVPDGPVLCAVKAHASVDLAEDDAAAALLAAHWNAVRDALAEYDDPHKSLTSTTADRMAEILRRAVDA